MFVLLLIFVFFCRYTHNWPQQQTKSNVPSEKCFSVFRLFRSHSNFFFFFQNQIKLILKATPKYTTANSFRQLAYEQFVVYKSSLFSLTMRIFVNDHYTKWNKTRNYSFANSLYSFLFCFFFSSKWQHFLKWCKESAITPHLAKDT